MGIKSQGYVRTPNGCFHVASATVGIDKINLFAFPALVEAREVEVDSDGDYEWRIYLEEATSRNVKRILKDMRTDRAIPDTTMRWSYFLAYLRGLGFTVSEVNGIATVTHGSVTHHINKG